MVMSRETGVRSRELGVWSLNRWLLKLETRNIALPFIIPINNFWLIQFAPFINDKAI